jgi:hypothetical protein
LVPIACTCDWHPWKYAPASARDVQMATLVDATGLEAAVRQIAV